MKFVRAGRLTNAIKNLKPVKEHGPWTVLCDNERFLDAAACKEQHKAAGVSLWHIPAKSPDLNPVEVVWSHLRKKLRAMDLADAMAKRPVLGKMAYKARVRRVVMTQKFQKTAGNCAKRLKKVCREVVAKKGAATSG